MVALVLATLVCLGMLATYLVDLMLGISANRWMLMLCFVFLMANQASWVYTGFFDGGAFKKRVEMVRTWCLVSVAASWAVFVAMAAAARDAVLFLKYGIFPQLMVTVAVIVLFLQLFGDEFLGRKARKYFKRAV